MCKCLNVTSRSLLTFPQFNKGSSILDSGTTDIYLSDEVFNEVKALVIQHLLVGTHRLIVRIHTQLGVCCIHIHTYIQSFQSF